VLAGELIVSSVIGDTQVPTLALAIVTGSLATSLFLEAAFFLAGYRAAPVFVCWAVIVAIAAVFRSRRAAHVAIDRYELIGVAAIALLVAFWCRHSAALLPTIHASGTAPIWADYFIHGTAIAQFGNPLATGRSAFALSDQPIGLYHFEPYLLPAAVSSLVELPALGLAASVLFPYGVLLLALGAYAYVGVVADRRTALVTALALLCLPDPSTYGLENNYFSFHWFLGASPGTAHALGVVFAAMTFAMLWSITRRRSCLWAAGLLALALFQVRALVFMLFAPALIAALVCETPVVRRQARSLVITLALTTAVIVAAVALVPALHDRWVRFSGFHTFMRIVHTLQAPSAYDGVYEGLQQRYGQVGADAFGIAAVIPGVLGALTILLPLSTVIAIRRSGWQTLDSLPYWCLAGWLTLVLVAPPASHGDATTYQYHAFPLVYVTAVVWTIVLLRRSTSWVPGVLAAAVALSLVVRWPDNPVQPRPGWGWQHFATPVDRGLVDVAAFVHARAVPGDTFALIPVDLTNILDDAATRFAALANVPAYLSRPALHIIRPELRGVVEQRVRELRELESTTDPDRVRNLLRTMNVTYLVTVGANTAAFDPKGALAQFRSGDAAVYWFAHQ
jgi:hypothetical protein